MIVKGLAMSFGAILCAAVPPVVEKRFTQQQMANSLLPLLITLAVPFLIPLILSSIHPNSMKVTAAWLVLAAVAFFAGSLCAMFSVRQSDANLWPVELVISGTLVTGALIGGAALGRARSKGA